MTRPGPFLVLLTALIASPLFASIYSVNDLGDAVDALPGNDLCATAGGVCTLRAAIQEANAHAGADQIAFAMAGTIVPPANLPAISSEVIIDATTTPGYAGTPVVILQGGGLRFGTGSSASQLAGMKIHDCDSAAVEIASSNVTIRRNHLGAVGGGNKNFEGVHLQSTSTSCVIGGAADGDGNVISANGIGVIVEGSGHSISDNFIGTNAAGTAAEANVGDGVIILAAATDIVVGGSTPATHNVISGNGNSGISVLGQRNTFAGNRIGTDASGSFAIPNGQSGVILAGANLTSIGTAAARNVISGNANYGVHVMETPPSTNTTFMNNYIGVDASGTAAIPNGQSGIRVDSAQVVIGTPAAGNVISGHSQSGIDLRQPITRSFIQNNVIGLDAAGMVDLGNQHSGIAVNGFGVRGAVTVGGVHPNEGNIISGNNTFGIAASFCDQCEFYGNTIGLAADRTTARGNHVGIYLLASDDGTIGAPGGGMNVISGNTSAALDLGITTNTRVVNNRIGTDVTGMLDRGNSVGITGVLGSDLEISSNLISGNDSWGVSVSLPNTRLFGNIIGRNVANDAPMPNGLGGVVLGDDNGVIGSPELGGNVIASNNGVAGILISIGSVGTTIAANSIFGNNAGSFEAGLGIDLLSNSGYGPEENDPLDPDSGGNELQNFPLLASALASPFSSAIAGSLNSTPLTPFVLHFYSNTVVDPTGYGEGETYLGMTNVMTDAAGNASFNWSGPAVAPGLFITSTATGPSGTSEFSLAAGAVATPAVHFSASSYSTTENGGTVTITVTREGDLSASSTVDYAMSNGTATSPSDYLQTSGTLTFNPGVASQTFDATIVADFIDEPTEEFNVTLTNPIGALITTPGTAVVTIEDPRADLVIRKESSYGAGQEVTFRITVLNVGPDTATDVVVTDVLPPGTTLLSASSTAGTCNGTTTVTCNIPTLAPGTGATITLLVSTNGAEVANTATVAANEIDPDPSNNTASSNASLSDIPTMSTWALFALMSLMAAIAVMRMRV